MIQIDMTMPEYCDDCPMLDEHGDYPMCRITGETRGYNFDIRKKRMDKCPMKPVDAVPVKHGRWIYEDTDPVLVPCSICGYRVYRHNNTRYCPNCGAKMDGD